MNYYPSSLVDGLTTAPPTQADMLKLPSAYGGAANSAMFDSYQQILGATSMPPTSMGMFSSAASHLVRIICNKLSFKHFYSDAAEP